MNDSIDGYFRSSDDSGLGGGDLTSSALTQLQSLRLSSLGQMDIPTASDNYLQVEDNAFQVASAWILGAAVPLRSQNASAVKLSLPLGASEKVVACFPVVLLDGQNGAGAGSGYTGKGSCSWLRSFEEFNELSAESTREITGRASDGTDTCIFVFSQRKWNAFCSSYILSIYC